MSIDAKFVSAGESPNLSLRWVGSEMSWAMLLQDPVFVILLVCRLVTKDPKH